MTIIAVTNHVVGAWAQGTGSAAKLRTTPTTLSELYGKCLGAVAVKKERPLFAAHHLDCEVR